MTVADTLPPHLRKYIVTQDYASYTAIDHAVWRFIMRQLKAYLSVHGHPSYLAGLERGGISTEEIPHIETMSRCLEQFGWRAVPVSGFLPPAAFMELQALGILPVGAVMRTLEHLMYTPAPDIVHEAAGHAPILVQPEFAAYLHQYAQVAKKAIISKEDMDLYEAIRILSDLKEDPTADPKVVAAAEKTLVEVSQAITTPSEATLVGRMNWWTVEYGLIGSVDAPKLYGAGLLSSVAESRWCLAPSVKKLPLTVQCIEYAYDITEPQPQLFATPDFATLSTVLEELADRLSFRRGGMHGLLRAKEAETVNTVEYNSGLQVSGKLTGITEEPALTKQPVEERRAVYLQFTGPVQLCFRDAELKGHGTQRHAKGFGAPVGLLKDMTTCLSACSEQELASRGLRVDASAALEFASGVAVRGQLTHMLRRDGRNLLFTFRECTVTYQGKTLFEPAWGEYDMAVGSAIPSVFGGPADRGKYGETEDFIVKHVPPRQFTPKELALIALYARVRSLRQQSASSDELEPALAAVLSALDADHREDWLLRVEILECAHRLPRPPAWQAQLLADLQRHAVSGGDQGTCINDGINLARLM